jgi:hypothetical protein
MIVLDARAAEVMTKLWKLARENDCYCTLNNNGFFMALTIEIVDTHIISICHYGECEGDLMRDPEMVFIKQEEGFYAVYYRNDWVEKEEYSGWIYNGKVICRDEKLQKRHTEFASDWLITIKDQQQI